MINQIFKKRRIEYGFELKCLPCDGGSNNGENSGADYGAHAERGGAQPAGGFLLPFFRVLRIGNKLVNIFFAKKLCAQSPPSRVLEKNFTLCKGFAQPL